MTQTKETNWLMTVARAAPWTPIPKVKMKRGSRTMFRTPPSIVVTIAVLAKPWVVM